MREPGTRSSVESSVGAEIQRLLSGARTRHGPDASCAGCGSLSQAASSAWDRAWPVHRKGIVEAHGGKAWAESGLGMGSTFFLTVPIARRKAAVGHNEQRADRHRARCRIESPTEARERLQRESADDEVVAGPVTPSVRSFPFEAAARP